MSTDDDDILWLQCVPSIAAIYYHTELQRTHVLYCPDDPEPTEIHPRKLARTILNVLDSNDKKLALHFMQSVSAQKREDVVRSLQKARKGIRVGSIWAPTLPLQIRRLEGWAASLAQDDVGRAWSRRCCVPFDPNAQVAFPESSAVRHTRSHQAFLSPFFISADIFVKPACIVSISHDMVQNDDFSLIPSVKAALFAWMDAAQQLEQPMTLLFLVEESALYGDIPRFYQSSKASQETSLEQRRNKLHTSLEQLAKPYPIYLYLRSYQSQEIEDLVHKLVWLQHRHHLSFAKCMYLSWHPESSLLSQAPVSNIRALGLSERAGQNQSKWRHDFLQMLEKGSGQDEQVRYILPKDLDLGGHTSDYKTPLLRGIASTTVSEAPDKNTIHSVTSASTAVMQAWRDQLEAYVYPSAVKIQETSTASSTGGRSAQTISAMDIDVPSSPNTSKMSPEELAFYFADHYKKETVKDYIHNKGAFERGEDILHTLDAFAMRGDVKKLQVSCDAKGTSPTPYKAHANFVKSGEKTVIQWGHCSCPVGKQGKCKHCTALLLRFMFNPDEFSDEYRDEPVEIASEVHSEHETALSAEKVKSNTASRPEGASPVGKRGPPTAGEDQSKPVITSAQEESAPKSVAGSQPSSMPASPSTSTAVSATPASYKQKPARRRILPWAKESEASSKKTKRSGKQEDTEAKEASKKKRKTTDYTVKQTKQGYAKSKKDEPNEGENVMPKEKTPQRRKAATPISHESEDEDMQEASRSPPPKRTARPRRAATSKQKSYSVPSDDDSQGEQVMNRTGKRTAMQNEQGPSPDANLPEDIRGSADNDRMMTEAGPPSTGALGDESDATTDDESLGPILRASQTGQIDSQRSAMSWEENQKNNEITQKSRTEDLFDELGL